MEPDSLFNALSVLLFGNPELGANFAILGAVFGGGIFSSLFEGLFGRKDRKDKAAEDRIRAQEAKAEAEAEEARRKARERETKAARRFRESTAGTGEGLLSFFNPRGG